MQAPGVIPTPPVIPKLENVFTGTNVRNDSSVKVWCNHDVKLGWVLDQLHSAIINNHFFVLDERIFLWNSSGDFKEKTINQFHDVCLVNNWDFLSSAQMGEFEGVLNQSFRFGSGGDFEWFHDTWVNLVLNSWEFSFGIFSDDGNIDVVMFVSNWWEGVAKVNIGV